MPALQGLSYREAQIRLLSQGLRMGQVFYEYSDSLPSGVVLWQSIAAQSPVAAGTSVDLVVSQGPRPSVVVPSVVSLSLQEAEQLLQEAGLTLGQVTAVTDPTFLPNTVIAQEPAAGQLVPPGTVVSVTVTR
jgi:serine/threonine-protein kinase